MSPCTLTDYLATLEARTPEAKIDLGLDRVARVYQRLFSNDPWSKTAIITVAGTNGKGSTVRFCEAMGMALGRTTFAYTSPHIQRFTERVRINGAESTEDQWLAAFARVDQARDAVALTYFEQVTLAAFWMASQHVIDLMILEVGLGGRLDAVNVVDSDVAILTSIGTDHQEFLGPTRMHIGREKLGIARDQRPIIIGERDWLAELDPVLLASGAHAFRIGIDFDWFHETIGGEHAWSIRSTREPHAWRLPRPRLLGDYQLNNAACAVMALDQLYGQVLTEKAIAEALSMAELAGRFEVVAQSPVVILDVAHNREAAMALASALTAQACLGRTLAVFGALRGKDIEAMADALEDSVDHWFIGGLGGARGQSSLDVVNRLRAHGIASPLDGVESISDALDRALAIAEPEDRVVVFGSFQVLAELRSRWCSEPLSD